PPSTRGGRWLRAGVSTGGGAGPPRAGVGSTPQRAIAAPRGGVSSWLLALDRGRPPQRQLGGPPAGRELIDDVLARKQAHGHRVRALELAELDATLARDPVFVLARLRARP